MKKIVILFAVLALSVTAFAGPLIGVSVIPYNTNFTAAILSVGWDFGNVNLEVITGNFAFAEGNFLISALWTPSVGSFGYRAGLATLLDWESGNVIYEDLLFVVGISDTWGPVQIFGELDILPYGVLTVVPRIGVNILFDGLIPTVSQ